MGYRARRRSTGISLPLVLALFGVGVGVFGLFCLTIAFYLFDAVGTTQGTQTEFVPLVLEPIGVLYEGGLLTAGIGGALTLLGTLLILTARPR